MADNNSNNPNEFNPFGDGFDREELERMMRELLGGGMDPEQLAQAAGLPVDPGMLNTLFSTLRNAAQRGDAEGIDWSVARSTAVDAVAQLESPAEAAVEQTATAINAAFSVANLWLDEVTDMGVPAESPKLLDRTQWVVQSIDTWVSLAEPVALSIADTITEALSEQLPEQMAPMIPGLSNMLRNVGGALFATQLGAAIGKLAGEVVSGGDIGIPLLAGPGVGGGSMLPDNVAEFAAGLEQSQDDVAMYLTVRELAHARLFRHAKWLGPHVVSAVTDYARGIHIDSSQMLHLSEDIDPTNTEQIQELLQSGALIPPKTPAQEAALARLETLLALIEGWVDAVTAEATARVPGAEAIAEMVRRRRATGGPAERAFSTLVGLELRPRKLREAARMWKMVAERGDAVTRDSVWEHPDLLPSAEEIERPAVLLERLGLAGETPEQVEDDLDRALAELLEDADSIMRGDSVGDDNDDTEDTDADNTDADNTDAGDTDASDSRL